jgi:23S rRNA pseudouridine1911/1915/1917 synthase
MDRHALHASRLQLTHPKTKQPMDFFAPLPADFERIIAVLREME